MVIVGALLQGLCVVIRTAGARAVLRRQALAGIGCDDTAGMASEALASQSLAAPSGELQNASVRPDASTTATPGAHWCPPVVPRVTSQHQRLADSPQT